MKRIRIFQGQNPWIDDEMKEMFSSIQFGHAGIEKRTENLKRLGFHK